MDERDYKAMNEELNQPSSLGAVISWVAASEKLPSVEQNGNKVLIYRIMNDSQESLAISIHETSMVKYCNVDETWWMELPKPPCL
jgi:RecB family endonuclease NucS